MQLYSIAPEAVVIVFMSVAKKPGFWLMRESA